MRCRKCGKNSNLFICRNCENEFKKVLKEQANIEYDFSSGDTLYVLKNISINGKRRYEPAKVIFKGPNSWVLRKWEIEGDKFIKYRFAESKYQSVFECSEIGKTIILSRKINEFYKTKEDCLNANESFLKDIIINSKKKAIYELIEDKLNKVLSEEVSIENINIDEILPPIIDEVKLRGELYQKIRLEVKQEIIENEEDTIRNEIINQLYNDIKLNINNSLNKFISNDIKLITSEYNKNLSESIKNYLNNNFLIK